MIRLTHSITGLEPGGAENYLLRLLRESGSATSAHVVSLRSGGALADQFREAGISLQELSVTTSVRGALRLAATLPDLRRRQVDLLQGWMYHGNLVASAIAWRRTRVVWNVRETVYDLAHEKPATAWAIRLSARLSSTVDCVVYNSVVSRDQHRRLGFRPVSDVVIANGVNVEQFAPDEAQRALTRRSLGINGDAVVIGRFGRSHPMKDHRTFFRALGQVAKSHHNVIGLVVGSGCDTADGPILRDIQTLGLTERVRVLGDRRDVADLLRCCDIACSTSAWGEAYPNVVAEAMAVGAAVIGTDVGDSAAIIGHAGIVIPPRSAEALAQALTALIANPSRRKAFGSAALQRAREYLPLKASVIKYNSLYQELSAKR